MVFAYFLVYLQELAGVGIEKQYVATGGYQAFLVLEHSATIHLGSVEEFNEPHFVPSKRETLSIRDVICNSIEFNLT